MCAGALLQSRVKRVVWGAPNVQLGADGSWVQLLNAAEDEEEEHEEAEEGTRRPRAKHPYHYSLQVRRNVLRDECSMLLKEFFQQRRLENDKKT